LKRNRFPWLVLQPGRKEAGLMGHSAHGVDPVSTTTFARDRQTLHRLASTELHYLKRLLMLVSRRSGKRFTAGVGVEDATSGIKQ